MKSGVMNLMVLSWQAFTGYIIAICFVYYSILLIRFGLLKKIFNGKAKEEHDFSIQKMEETGSPFSSDQKPDSRQPQTDHHVEAASLFLRLTDEINALLLQSAAHNLPREIVLSTLIRIIRGYKIQESDPDALQSIKEIVISEAERICHIKYSLEELSI